MTKLYKFLLKNFGVDDSINSNRYLLVYVIRFSITRVKGDIILRVRLNSIIYIMFMKR